MNEICRAKICVGWQQQFAVYTANKTPLTKARCVSEMSLRASPKSCCQTLSRRSHEDVNCRLWKVEGDRYHEFKIGLWIINKVLRCHDKLWHNKSVIRCLRRSPKFSWASCHSSWISLIRSRQRFNLEARGSLSKRSRLAWRKCFDRRAKCLSKRRFAYQLVLQLNKSFR